MIWVHSGPIEVLFCDGVIEIEVIVGVETSGVTMVAEDFLLDF
jgi:hypothetical protein